MKASRHGNIVYSTWTYQAEMSHILSRTEKIPSHCSQGHAVLNLQLPLFRSFPLKMSGMPKRAVTKTTESRVEDECGK